MMQHGTVSIIMAAYNVEAYILESIQSVIDQSYSDWELIIVNDGSNDDTLKIIQSFNDDRIISITQSNGGVSSARNKALEMVSGEYITFLDADDTLTKDSLNSRIEYFEKHSEIDVLDGQITVKDAYLKDELRRYKPYYNGKLLPKLLALDDKVFFGVIYMFKQELLNTVRFKEKMTHGEDLLFYIELSSKYDLNYGYIDQIIYNYRSGHSSAMANLEGLENGYIRLLEEINKLQCTNLIQWIYLKIKITKIMFLSYLNQRKYFKAITSVLYIMKGKK